MEDQIAQSEATRQTWLELHSEEQQLSWGDKSTNQNGSRCCVTSPNTAVFSCINDALHWVTSGHNCSDTILQNEEMTSVHPPSSDISKAAHIQLLVTGSLYMVGAVMNIIGYTADDL